ncbi:hypothetical protein MMC07_003972 [Pseudocyphellaria aurata]|nr:hypothetical protein [Pseudocyphellaria aurata]
MVLHRRQYSLPAKNPTAKFNTPEYREERGRRGEVYCPNCRSLTKKERANQLTNARRQKVRDVRAREGDFSSVEDNVSTGVEQQAESSITREHRGAFGFLPEPDDSPLSTSEDTEVSPSLLDENTLLQIERSTGVAFADNTYDSLEEMNVGVVASFSDNASRNTGPHTRETVRAANPRAYTLKPYAEVLNNRAISPHTAPGSSLPAATNFSS